MAKTGGDVLVDVLPVKSGTRSERTIKGYTDTQAVGHRSGMPAREELQQAADVLNAGEKIAILAGQGALEAGDELEAIAEKLGAPDYQGLVGQSLCPRRLALHHRRYRTAGYRAVPGGHGVPRYSATRGHLVSVHRNPRPGTRDFRSCFN